MTRNAFPDPAHAALSEALAGIRSDFIDGLFPAVNELDYQKQALRQPAQVPAALASIQKIAHKLSGLAGSVGFPALGARAAEIDITVSNLRKRSASQREVDALDGSVEQLLDLIEAALDEAL